ncbi:MAG: hypothetical protein ABH864_02865 [archaeon]
MEDGYYFALDGERIGKGIVSLFLTAAIATAGFVGIDHSIRTHREHVSRIETDATYKEQCIQQQEQEDARRIQNWHDATDGWGKYFVR